MDNHFVICSCHSPEHTLQFVTDGEEVWVDVQLIQYRNIFKRIWIAIKYILGYKCKYGHWDCTNLSKQEANKLYNWLKHKKDKLWE